MTLSGKFERVIVKDLLERLTQRHENSRSVSGWKPKLFLARSPNFAEGEKNHDSENQSYSLCD